jgi:hypothetical protein
MGGFIQIIEMQTTRFEEVEALGKEIRARLDDGSPSSPLRGTTTPIGTAPAST